MQINRFFICLLFIIFAAPVFAADRGISQAFMQVIGFDKQLESLRLTADNAPRMLGLEPADYGADWTKLADEVFEGEKIKADALDMLTQTLSEEALLHGAEFYASPLGVRLAEAENISHFADEDIKETEGAAILAELEASGSKKIEYWHDMIDNIGAVENTISAFHEVQIQFLLAAMNSGLTERRIAEDDLRAMLSVRDEAMVQASIDNMVIANAYIYRDFNVDEMGQYSVALAHPQMRELYELMNGITFAILIDRFKVLAHRMVDLKPNQAL